MCYIKVSSVVDGDTQWVMSKSPILNIGSTVRTEKSPETVQKCTRSSNCQSREKEKGDSRKQTFLYDLQVWLAALLDLSLDLELPNVT